MGHTNWGDCRQPAAPAAAFGKLQFAGAAPITIRRAEAEPAPQAPKGGTKIELVLDGEVFTASLLEDSAPADLRAFKALLPTRRADENTKWSGAMAHFLGTRPAGSRTDWTADRAAREPNHVSLAGYWYYHPSYSGIRICYGDGQQSGAFTVSSLTALARFDGDWSGFREKAGQFYITGARPARIRLLD